MFPIFIANSFYIFALGLVIPSLPFMVLSRGGEAALASIIFTAFSAAAFLSQPFWGALADKYGAKNILVISAILTSFAYLAMAFSETVTGLFLARIFAGFSAGWLASSLTYMANISQIQNRTKAMGVLGASFGIGFTLGPATSGIILQNFNYEITAFISAGISFAVACFSILILPISRKIADNSESFAIKKGVFPPLKAILTNEIIKFLFFCYFVVLLIFTALEGSFALWIKFILSRDATFLSWILTIAGIVSIIIQGGLLGWLNKRFSEKTLVLCGILLLIAGFLLLPFSRNELSAFIPVILVAAGIGLHNPCIQSLVSKNVGEEKHGIMMGSLQSCASLSRICGPAMAGYLFIALGAMQFYFACAAILALIFLLIISRLVNHQKHN